MKKNILIISIYYPPIQSIASNRIYSFAKYLDKNKYNIYVHTLDENKEFKNNLDGVIVSRVKNNRFFKPLLFEKRTNKFIHYSKVIYNLIIKRFTNNIYQKWIDNSYRLLKNNIQYNQIDLMISSFAPDSSHILALKLKKDFPNLKWISDMRDEMSFSPYIDTKVKENLRVLEKDIFKYTNAITSVSKPILDEFRTNSINQNILFREIRNGYDFQLNDNLDKNSIFTITYSGNFYADRNPINFLKALEIVVLKYDIDIKI